MEDEVLLVDEDVVLLAEEDEALLSELDAVELLPVGVLSFPLQATMAPAHDTAPASKMNNAFPCFMKEPPVRVTEDYNIGSQRGRCKFFLMGS